MEFEIKKAMEGKTLAINFVSVKCPECGAQLEVEEGRTQAFCTYCGTKVLIQNENEHIYRHIDEAAIRYTELEMKRLEMEEEKRKERCGS